MTKLTIKIDENINITGTIISEEENTEDYDVYYYQPECPWSANCEYTGNVLLPMESNIAGNTAPTVPIPPGWGMPPKVKTNMWYNMNKNLSLAGNLAVTGDSTILGNLSVIGTVKGVGSLSSIAVLTETQTPPSSGWTGRQGEIALSGDYIYLCIAPDTWIRWSIERTW